MSQIRGIGESIPDKLRETWHGQLSSRYPSSKALDGILRFTQMSKISTEACNMQQILINYRLARNVSQKTCKEHAINAGALDCSAK
jgi:hypothetical protein